MTPIVDKINTLVSLESCWISASMKVSDYLRVANLLLRLILPPEDVETLELEVLLRMDDCICA